jgi:molybdate transport system substrate-binding protein
MLKVISSMATRSLLFELAGVWSEQGGVAITVESVGGVHAARRVKAGEPFDGVVLASDAIANLIAGGSVVAGSQVGLVQSSVAVAVKAGASVPDISTEAALRSAVTAAALIGYSTGPSGVALLKVFERWGFSSALQPRLVQAPPGVPVGTLVAQGKVALGFQQLSELMSLPGITVVGVLPQAVSITTIFTAAVCTASTQREALAKWLAFCASAQTADIKLRHGMQAS